MSDHIPPDESEASGYRPVVLAPCEAPTAGIRQGCRFVYVSDTPAGRLLEVITDMEAASLLVHDYILFTISFEGIGIYSSHDRGLPEM